MSNSTKQISLKLPKRLLSALDALSRETGRTRSELIREAIEELLRRKGVLR